MFSLAPILIHSEAVPQEARDALRAAIASAPEHREADLERAAHILFRDTDLECRDVRELVGLECGECA